MAPAPLNKLPPDVAEMMLKMIWAGVWGPVNTRTGHDGEARKAGFEQEQHYTDLLRLSKGLDIDKSLEYIKWMAGNSGWRAANIRNGHGGDAENDERGIQENYNRLKAENQMGPQLIDNITRLVRAAGWHAANTYDGRTGDATGDMAEVDDAMFYIKSEQPVVKNLEYKEPNIQNMESKVAGASLLLYNPGATEMSAEWTREYATSETLSTEETVGFEVTVSTEIDVGIPLVMEGSVTMSASNSWSQTMGKSKDKRKAEIYKFNVPVAAWSTKHVQCTVMRAVVDVPYTATIEISKDELREVQGRWKGMVFSKLIMNTIKEEALPEDGKPVVPPGYEKVLANKPVGDKEGKKAVIEA